MARWLNPAKLALLLLMDMYRDDEFPHDVGTLPVLEFIASHILDDYSTTPNPHADRWRSPDKTFALLQSVDPIEKVLGLYPWHGEFPGVTAWDHFVECMWNLNSLHQMNEFISIRLEMMFPMSKERLQKLRDDDIEVGEEEDGARFKFSKNSPFGIFARRAKIEHHQLRFHDCGELWKAFVRYRAPTVERRSRRTAGLTTFAFDQVLRERDEYEGDGEGAGELTRVIYQDGKPGGKGVGVSTHDVEGLLEFQIEQMQKFGNRVPISLRDRFRDLLEQSFLKPSLTHHLSFLDAWRAGDFTTAFESVHRYFDYTMHNRDRLFYQYALMNLAVLQADFGCHQEAVNAMLETVATARENKDNTCLNFALNWLFHFGRAHPSLVEGLEADSLLGTGKESLAYLRVKSKEAGMWTLWGSVLLSEAKLGLSNGESVATAAEQLVRSSQVILEKNMTGLFNSKISLSMSFWERMGQERLSMAEYKTFRHCHTANSTLEDQFKLHCHAARVLANHGRYADGLRLLQGFGNNGLRSWQGSQYVAKYRALIKLQQALCKNNLSGASRFLAQLQCNKEDDLEPEMAVMVDSLQVELLTRRDNLQEAFSTVQRLLTAARDERKDVAVEIRLSVIKALLLGKAGRPLRGFSVAMRAANKCFRARNLGLLWPSLGAVAEMLIALGEYSAAEEILWAVIPRTLEWIRNGVSARLYSCLGDAYMGLAGEEGTGAARRVRLTEAVAAVKAARAAAGEVGDARMELDMVTKRYLMERMMVVEGGSYDAKGVLEGLENEMEQYERMLSG